MLPNEKFHFDEVCGKFFQIKNSLTKHLCMIIGTNKFLDKSTLNNHTEVQMGRKALCL